MNNINDVVNSIKATLYERISNPLLSAFLISWFIWNYEFILVFFSSSMETIEKLDYIKINIFPFCFDPLQTVSNFWTVVSLLLGPLLTALIYLYIIFPSVGKKVFEDHKEHIKAYEAIKVRIDGETSMSEEDVMALKTELRTIHSIHSKELDEKENEISSLDNTIDVLNTDIDSLRKGSSATIHKLTDKVDKSKIEITKAHNTIKLKVEKINTLTAEIDKLTKNTDSHTNSTNNKDISNPSSTTNEYDNIKLDEDSIGLLKIISNHSMGISISDIKNKVKYHRLVLLNCIKTLYAYDLLEKTTDHVGKEKIKTTEFGDKYLLDNKLV